MKFVENILESLDTYFAPKKESEKYIIILGLGAVIGYLGYLLFFDSAKSKHVRSEQTKSKLEKSIKENNDYLRSITLNEDRDYYIKKYDKDISNLNKNISSLNGKITFIDKNLKELSDMLFNKKSWSKFLNSITDRAAAQDVKIEYIKNKYVDSNISFGHVLEISVGCKGQYKSIIKFINELEQNTLVTDIYGSKFMLESNLTEENATESNSSTEGNETKTADQDVFDIVADINISVWGVNR